MGFVLQKMENIVGKGENAGNQHFLLFLKCFQKNSLLHTDQQRITQERNVDYVGIDTKD